MEEKGFIELMSVIGRYGSLGPLVRTGLLRQREDRAELQRYHGYVPTANAAQWLLHVPKHELILVRPGEKHALLKEMEQDPMPEGPFKEAFAEPTGPQYRAAEMADNGWCKELRKWLEQGYMQLEVFCNRHSILMSEMVNDGLCSYGTLSPEAAGPRVIPTAQGSTYLHAVHGSDLILIRPGMELPLLKRCAPAAAMDLIRLPQATADVMSGPHPLRASWV